MYQYGTKADSRLIHLEWLDDRAGKVIGVCAKTQLFLESSLVTTRSFGYTKYSPEHVGVIGISTYIRLICSPIRHYNIRNLREILLELHLVQKDILVNNNNPGSERKSTLPTIYSCSFSLKHSSDEITLYSPSVLAAYGGNPMSSNDDRVLAFNPDQKYGGSSQVHH